MKVLCLLADGFEETEAVTVIDVMRRAGLEVSVFALQGGRAVGSHGLILEGLSAMSTLESDAYQALFLPGGPHYRQLEADERVQGTIAAFMTSGRTVAAICAAPTILGRAGWLKGRRYTCFTSLNSDFGGEYCDDYAVVDGNLVTGRSMAAALDFALVLAAKLAGPERAADIKAHIYYRG